MAKNSMFLYGKNSVFERLRADPQSIRRIYLQDNFDDAAIKGLIKSATVPFQLVSDKQLSRIKQAANLQGVVAEIAPFEYSDFEDIVNSDSPGKNIIFLDRIYDPQNLGAIIRTVSCFGRFAIVIPKHKACVVTDTVLHIACGGENFVPIAMVSNLSQAVRQAKKSGYWIVGAVVEQGEDITSFDFPFPLGLVLGSEGEGVRCGLQKHLDYKVRIPMQGADLSLNVAMACIVFCYEVVRQRK